MTTTVKYGLILGVLSCAWVLLEYILGFHGNNVEAGEKSGFLAIIIPLAVIFLALREHKTVDLGGSLTFAQAIKAGLIICSISSLITTLFMLLYNNMLNPEWIETTLTYQKNKMYESGSSDEEIEMAMMMTEKFYGSYALYPIMYVSSLFMGMVFTLLDYLALRLITKLSGRQQNSKP